MIDLAGIERDRDQLWAEAVVRYRAGEKWWLLPGSALEALAIAEQKARYSVDVWEPRIEEWLGDRQDVSIPEVVAFLGIDTKDPPQRDMNRVQKILTNLEFTKYRAGKGGVRQNRYWREKE